MAKMNSALLGFGSVLAYAVEGGEGSVKLYASLVERRYLAG